jgi:hypothetical protein
MAFLLLHRDNKKAPVMKSRKFSKKFFITSGFYKLFIAHKDKNVQVSDTTKLNIYSNAVYKQSIQYFSIAVSYLFFQSLMLPQLSPFTFISLLVTVPRIVTGILLEQLCVLCLSAFCFGTGNNNTALCLAKPECIFANIEICMHIKTGDYG